MTDNHPITPPPELVQQWLEDSPEDDELGIAGYIATQAARWGFDHRTAWDAEWLEAQLQKARDQELEACCMWLDREVCVGWRLRQQLRAARRPKPPSLKEQSLALIDKIQGSKEAWDIRDLDLVRRALERLPND